MQYISNTWVQSYFYILALDHKLFAVTWNGDITNQNLNCHSQNHGQLSEILGSHSAEDIDCNIFGCDVM
jgi:hypothetical protein